MELESKERKQRNYNTFLVAFVAVTFTVALLEGVGLIVFYAHFQNANTAIADEMQELGARVSTLEVPSVGSTGETAVAKFTTKLSIVRHFQICSIADLCMQTIYTHSGKFQFIHI